MAPSFPRSLSTSSPPSSPSNGRNSGDYWRPEAATKRNHRPNQETPGDWAPWARPVRVHRGARLLPLGTTEIADRETPPKRTPCHLPCGPGESSVAQNRAPPRGFCGAAGDLWLGDGLDGGEGGIRTHGTREGTTVFETAPIDHSGTSPHEGCGPTESGRTIATAAETCKTAPNSGNRRLLAPLHRSPAPLLPRCASGRRSARSLRNAIPAGTYCSTSTPLCSTLVYTCRMTRYTPS